TWAFTFGVRSGKPWGVHVGPVSDRVPSAYPGHGQPGVIAVEAALRDDAFGGTICGPKGEGLGVATDGPTADRRLGPLGAEPGRRVPVGPAADRVNALLRQLGIFAGVLLVPGFGQVGQFTIRGDLSPEMVQRMMRALLELRTLRLARDPTPSEKAKIGPVRA